LWSAEIRHRLTPVFDITKRMYRSRYVGAAQEVLGDRYCGTDR
jgi:hypothetical protein